MLLVIEFIFMVISMATVISYVESGIVGTIGMIILNAKWTEVKEADYLHKDQLHGMFCSLFGGWFTFKNFIDYSCDPAMAELEPIKKYGYIAL